MAAAELDSATVPTTTGTAAQLDGMLALSLVAAADKPPSDVDAPLEYATDLAIRADPAWTSQGLPPWGRADPAGRLSLGVRQLGFLYACIGGGVPRSSVRFCR